MFFVSYEADKNQFVHTYIPLKVFDTRPEFMKHARKDGLLPLHIACCTNSSQAVLVIQWLLTASLIHHEVKYKEKTIEKTLEELVEQGENSIARTDKRYHMTLQTLTTAISGGSSMATSYIRDQMALDGDDIGTVEEEEHKELLIRTAYDAGM